MFYVRQFILISILNQGWSNQGVAPKVAKNCRIWSHLQLLFDLQHGHLNE